MKRKPLLLFLTCDINFFIHHRLPLAKAAKEAGYLVHIAGPHCAASQNAADLGFRVHHIPIKRSSMQWQSEIRSLFYIHHLYQSLQPDLVHLIAIKPIIYGGIVAGFNRIPKVIGSVPGLGYTFIATGAKALLLRNFIKFLYFIARLLSRGTLIFENPDDRQYFIKSRLIKANKTVLIRSVGVDLNHFIAQAEPAGQVVVALIARMLWHKGIAEYIAAIRLLRQAGVKARFILIGGLDQENPAHIHAQQVQAWTTQLGVEWWGYQKDILSCLAQCHIICLPSYREGLPRILLEASACTKPIITTDVPGCREAVIHNVTGILIKPKDAAGLAEAIQRLITDPELRQRMGQAGRQYVAEKFAVEKVVAETLQAYQHL